MIFLLTVRLALFYIVSKEHSLSVVRRQVSKRIKKRKPKYTQNTAPEVRRKWTVADIKWIVAGELAANRSGIGQYSSTSHGL